VSSTATFVHAADSEARMRALETAFPDGDFPAISVFEVGGAYFRFGWPSQSGSGA
jgi:hypothetical protein